MLPQNEMSGSNPLAARALCRVMPWI